MLFIDGQHRVTRESETPEDRENDWRYQGRFDFSSLQIYEELFNHSSQKQEQSLRVYRDRMV